MNENWVLLELFRRLAEPPVDPVDLRMTGPVPPAIDTYAGPGQQGVSIADFRQPVAPPPRTAMRPR